MEMLKQNKYVGNFTQRIIVSKCISVERLIRRELHG